MTNYIELKNRPFVKGSVVRYKDFAVATKFEASADAWAVEVFGLVDDLSEMDFEECRLENLTEWEGQRFATEGEALMAGFQFIDWKF